MTRSHAMTGQHVCLIYSLPDPCLSWTVVKKGELQVKNVSSLFSLCLAVVVQNAAKP